MAEGIGGAIEDVRRRMGDAVFERIAGTDGAAERSRLHQPGERWFPADSPIARVHGDASMFVGGLAALLLQSLHPLAMAGVDAHSGYRGDPWGRLARTSHFLAVTTYGSAADAERAVAAVRAVHERVHGVAPDGRAYSATDPHLVSWVHLAEVDCFLRAYQRYGAHPLTDDEADEYVRQTGIVATKLGAHHVPRDRRQLAAHLGAYRKELRGTPAARTTARYLLVSPPLPMRLRGFYAPLAAAAVGLLPRWTRWPLRLPWLPLTEATLVRTGGHVITGAIRWSLPAASAIADAR